MTQNILPLNLAPGGNIEVPQVPEGFRMGISARDSSESHDNTREEGDRQRNLDILKEATGLAGNQILMLDQVHQDRILTVEEIPTKEALTFGEADGFVTTLENVALVIRTADCVPVILIDERNRVLGAVHSGWRGTNMDITGKCIDLMKNKYSSDPWEMKIFILPSIGPQSYEVGEDVAQHFPEDISEENGKLFLNLWSNIEKSALRHGVRDKNIINFQLCNMENNDKFFSHRMGDLGRNLNFAYMY